MNVDAFTPAGEAYISCNPILMKQVHAQYHMLSYKETRMAGLAVLHINLSCIWTRLVTYTVSCVIVTTISLAMIMDASYAVEEGILTDPVPVPPLMHDSESTPETMRNKHVLLKTAPENTRIHSPMELRGKMDSTQRSQEKSKRATLPLPPVITVINLDHPETRIITPRYNDVLTAVLRGDRMAVRQLLNIGRWVDKPGSSGLKPLMAAVINRDEKMVKLLLDHGATPTLQALKLAREKKDAEIILLLEQRGAY